MSTDTGLKKHCLSDHLLEVARTCENRKVDCDLLLKLLGPRGPAILVLILSAPFLMPIALPGISTLFGSLICFLGIVIAFGSSIRLPETIAKRTFPGAMLSKALFLAIRLIKRVEPVLKSRIEFLFLSKVIKIIIGLVVVTGGLVVVLPLPPGANFISSLVCMIVALGWAAKDGVLLLSGIALFFGKIALYFFFFLLGADWLQSYF